MRRIVAFVLIGVGAFCLVIAPLMRFWLLPSVAKAPLDQFTETVSEAPDATYLDIGALAVQEGRTLIATRTVRGDVKDGTDDRAVWDVFVKVVDPEKPGETAEDRLVSATTDRVAFDRRTSEAIDCCGAHVNGEPVRHEGIEYKFPFGAEKKTYQYFDTTLKRALPMEYSGSEQIEGVEVYRYEQVIPPESIQQLDVPGSLIERTEDSVPVDRYYSNTRRVWVEPKTGVIVKGQEEQFSTLRDDTGADVLTVTQATLTFNDDTVKDQAETARDGARMISILGTYGPILLAVLGLVAFVVGVWMLRAARRQNVGGDAAQSSPRKGGSHAATPA